VSRPCRDRPRRAIDRATPRRERARDRRASIVVPELKDVENVALARATAAHGIHRAERLGEMERLLARHVVVITR